MQVTIDSNEPLDKVLRVVGALYDVRVSADGAQESAPEQAAAPRPARATKKGTPARGGSRRRTEKTADTSEIRRWARENGFEVSDRGRVPGPVLEAFRSSQSA